MAVSNSADNFRLVKAIEEKLFTAEERRIAASLESLHKKNLALSDKPGDGFSFAGNVYRSVNAPQRGQATFIPLHLSLTDEMLAIANDRELVANERQMIGQVLLKLIRPCRELQDYRDALPDCLKDCIPSIQHLSRYRPEAYTIEGDPRAERQYRKILPRIEFYSAARLVY